MIYEVRKLYCDMTLKEQAFILNLVINTNYKFTEYCIKRMFDRRLNSHQVLTSMEKGQIIEYHRKGNEHRVLIRTNLNVKEDLCIVLRLKKGLIITVFKNSKRDWHKSIDLKKYDSAVNIIREMGGN